MAYDIFSHPQDIGRPEKLLYAWQTSTYTWLQVSAISEKSEHPKMLLYPFHILTFIDYYASTSFTTF